MPLEYIDNLLQSRGLKNPTFSVLEINATLYHSFVFQPKGDILATANHVRNASLAPLLAKCKNFIELALDKNVELAIMPEYTCPKELINEIIRDSLFPREGNLWILGCQSLTKEELNSIVGQDSVEWFFEEEVLNNPGNFFNPIFYLFKTRDDNGLQKNIGIIQFKTTPSADLLERDNMILGTKIYVFRNNPGSTHLLTYICSDVLNFNETHFDQNTQYIHQPFLIIHIQLNPHPRHPDIQRHRQFFFRPRSDTKEIICLNWARQTTINGSVIDFGGSALYTKSEQLDASDQKVTNNHKKGLYYTFWGSKHTHAYYFNNDEAIYYFRNTKVSQIGAAAATVNRTGPEILEAYSWCDSENKWKHIEPNDGVKDLCSQGNYHLPIFTSDALNPVDKERIATLSCGYMRKKRWYDIEELEFFTVRDEEIIKRVTFVQDPHLDAARHRIEILGKFSMLINTVLTNHANFPLCINDLINNSRIEYVFQNGKCDYDCNLYPISRVGSSAAATVAFIGIAQQAICQQVYDEMSVVIGGDKSRRLVIWYLDDNSRICYVCDPKKPKVAGVFNPGNSITKED